jgi:hypothetical protein
MQPSTEISIDLTAQELLDPPLPTDIVQFEDIGEIDPALRTGAFTATATAASVQQAPAEPAAHPDDSVEIELTAEQIDALLSETSPR